MASEESKRLMLVSGRSIPALAEEMAGHLGVQLGKVEIATFSNGEIYVRYLESGISEHPLGRHSRVRLHKLVFTT